MIKRIQLHMKKRKIQARAAKPKQVVCASSQDIARKLASYNPSTKKADFLGPRVQTSELESVL